MAKSLSEIKRLLHEDFYKKLQEEGIDEFRPAQEKALDAGLLDKKSLLVCTPTASGKTLVAELAALNSIYNSWGKAIYIVPLKALAMEKYKEFNRKYGDKVKVAVSVGEYDSAESRLKNYDLIITTSEKLDSLLRHHTPWIKDVGTVVIDEIHLLNDVGRGPTLEILITLLKHLLKNIQILGLSATIGNAPELAEWLETDLVVDQWRPVELCQGVEYDNKVDFY